MDLDTREIQETDVINKYRITTNQNDMNFDVIHQYIGQSYWAKAIPAATMKKAMRHSLCFAVLSEAGQQVAFARIISDYATFAYLADVFVVDSHQGKGISKWMMETIVAHPELQGLRRTLLATADAHGLYQQFGFTPLAKPENFMEDWQPNVYQTI